MAAVIEGLHAVITPSNGMGIGNKDRSFLVDVNSLWSHTTELSLVVALGTEHH